MREEIAIRSTGPVPDVFDTTIEWLLGSLLVFMPLVFGARSAWTEEVVTVLSGCIVICFLFKLIIGRTQINHLSRPCLAILAAGDHIGRLRYVARALDGMQYNDLAEQSRQKAKELLETRCAQPDASAGDFVSLADVYRSQQDNDKAVEYYSLALALDYGQVHWRLTLARLLAETDRIPEAMNEARICVRLRPPFKAAKRLVAELSVHPKMLEQ